MPLPKAVDRHLTGEFHDGLCGSMTNNCMECCFFTYLPPCAVYVQRQRLLKLTREPYVCCAGLWPACGFDRPRAEMWMIAEMYLCLGIAFAGNRFMVQTRLNRKNTSCDDCLRCTHICTHLQFMLCCKPICGCTREQESLFKAHSCTLVCSHCQNATEIRLIEDAMTRGDLLVGGGLVIPPQGVIEELPNHFAQVGIRLAQAPVQQTM